MNWDMDHQRGTKGNKYTSWDNHYYERRGRDRGHSDNRVNSSFTLDDDPTRKSYEGNETFRYFHLPQYNAVVHEDNGIQLPRTDHTDQIRDSASMGNRSKLYQKHDRHFSHTVQCQTTANQRASSGEHQMMHHNQYNPILFGQYDSQTVSTGLSQEDLLQRKRREETWRKRKERRGNRHRIVNLPSVLLHSTNRRYKQNNHLQPQLNCNNYDNVSASLEEKSNEWGEGRYLDGQNNIEADIVGGDTLNTKNSRDFGIKGSMIRHQRDENEVSLGERWKVTRRTKKGTQGSSKKFLSSSSFKCNDRSVDNFYDDLNTELVEDVSYLNSLRTKPITRNENTQNVCEIEPFLPNKWNMDMDQKQEKNDRPPRTPSDRSKDEFDRYMDELSSPPEMLFTTTGKRPTCADFTPEFNYSVRNLVSLDKHRHQQQLSNKASPTSVMNLPESSMAGVRWNEELTQQYIVSPQLTKLHPDSQLTTIENQPKSILRSRFSSSDALKVPNKLSYHNVSNKVLDKFPAKQPEESVSKTDAVQSSEIQNFTENFICKEAVIQETSEFQQVPELIDGKVQFLDGNLPANASNPGNFPESYVHFIEAVAAVVIQTKFRQNIAKKHLRNLQTERKQSQNTKFTLTQNKMTPMVRRSYEFVRKANRNKKTKKETKTNAKVDFFALAAIQIQAAFRGWWIRDCLGVDNYCATMIQKTTRGYHCRRQFNLNLYRVIVVQSICRRWLAMDEAVTRIYCVVRIQAFVRGSLSRKKISPHVEESAAVVIQTQWRSFVSEMSFLRTYEDILVVQGIARGWIERKRVRSLQKINRNDDSQIRKAEESKTRDRIKYSKHRNDFSPSYKNHIEYMKTALTPPRSEVEVSSRAVPDVTNQFSDEFIANKSPKKEFIETSISKNKNETSILSSTRNDIERRRKHKELLGMKLQDEEKRRQETQAAEIAEIQFRRKRMALQAEARIYEERSGMHGS